MKHASTALLLSVFMLLTGCADKAAQTPGTVAVLPTIGANASTEEVAALLIAADDARVSTRALARDLPDLTRDSAYAIQRATLARRLEGGALVTGWKLGGTRITDSTITPDPLFGYSLGSQVYNAGAPLPASDFVGGMPEVEAEVTLYIGKDLPGPAVTREELIDAITGVGGAVEILSKRLAPHPEDEPSSLTSAHAVADNLSHGGVILGTTRVPAGQFDWDAESAVMRINGVEAAAGSSRDILGTHGTPLDAVLWLANELPKHGLHLKAGDYVVTGSLYANPTVKPGDTAELSFSTLGTVSFTVE